MSTPGGGQLSDKLRLAASKGQTARIKELLESGATFEPDKNSRTAVHYAALNGHATTIKACIQQGCEPDIQDVAGRSPMHLAVTDGHVEAVRALIEEGCPVDRQDQVNGNTALHEAAWNGYSKSVEVLVGYGRANVHAANRSGMRPLHMAVQNGHNESARVLLRNGTHPDTRNNHGETPLHIGATHGHVTCCRILISAKCDINAVNKDGNTPLHVAASLGKRKITKILVEAGCDVNIKNNKGQTAIDVARDHEYPEVIIIMTSTPKTPVMGRREQRARAAEQGMMGAQAASANPTSVNPYPNYQYPPPGHHGDMAAPKHKSPHMSSPRQSSSPHQRGHGPGAFSATDGPSQDLDHHGNSRVGCHGNSRPGTSGHERQQEQQYQNLQGQRQTPLERAMDLERQTHQNVQLGRITGNPHQHSEYYRDAFGSVHERPISNCNCMPYVRRLENQLEATKEKFMYDIESTTQMMEDKMKYFDKKMAHQSSCLDQLCKERIATERTECLHRIDRRAQKEQAEFERRSTVRINALRRELKGWFEDRFRHFERKYGDDFGIDLGSDHGREDPDDFDEPGASLLRSKSEGRLPSSQNDTSYERQGDSTNQRPGGKLPDKITATRTLQEVRYAKTKPIESTNDPYVLQEESENTATEKSQDSDQESQ
ncbi:ankyrin repeat domain-containing protein 6-like isoform X3 [Ptychodera flava]|uniref:ankyrin repeat domain-containing protein 6-like isoform X3 n=1 Tax=Ptychodera flava TaxID=63121 RepID=UPI00396A8E40